MNSDYRWEFEVSARPKCELKLFKDNKEVKLSDRITIVKDETVPNRFFLVIKKVDGNDIGAYKVVATNKCGTVSSQNNMNVSGAPSIIRKSSVELIVSEKKPIKAEFEVNGVPAPEVQWFKNDQPMSADTRLKLETRLKIINALTIDMAKVEDAATYTIKAKNDSGEASESFTLIVQSNLYFTINSTLNSFLINFNLKLLL